MSIAQSNVYSTRDLAIRILKRATWKMAGRKPNQRSRIFLTLLFALTLIQLAGCRARLATDMGYMVDAMCHSYRDDIWARRAYNLQYRGQYRPNGDHFRRGYIAGFSDVSDGGDGHIPAMPPECYWSYQYQSEQGSKCVEAWFDGYPAGVAAARKYGAGKFRGVPVSDLAQRAATREAQESRLPSDVKIVDADLAEIDEPVPPTIYDEGVLDAAPESSVRRLFNVGSGIRPRIKR